MDVGAGNQLGSRSPEQYSFGIPRGSRIVRRRPGAQPNVHPLQITVELRVSSIGFAASGQRAQDALFVRDRGISGLSDGRNITGVSSLFEVPWSKHPEQFEDPECVADARRLGIAAATNASIQNEDLALGGREERHL
jgi:hypothetical protein